jgi:hypothetical protein
MRIKTKQAIEKAEEFISERHMGQRTAILSATEHAMQQKGSLSGGGVGGGVAGAWKTANNVPLSINTPSMAIPLLSLSNLSSKKRRAREGGVRGTAR